MRIAKKSAKFVWPDWTLIAIVAVSALAIAGALTTWLMDTPQQVVEKEMTRLADDYYIEFLYPRLLGLMTKPPESLKKYAETGAQITYLRQLLHYNDNSHANMAPTFEDMGCNTNATFVRFFPVEPYGPRDYTTQIVMKCDEFE